MRSHSVMPADPAIDILDGNAVRLVAGRLRASRRSTTRTRSTPRAAGSSGRERACTSSTSTAPSGRARQPRAPARGSPRELGVPVQSAAACARVEAVDAALAAGAARVDPRHRRVHAIRDLLDAGRSRARRPRASSRSTCAAGSVADGGLDRDDRLTAAAAVASLARARRAPLRVHRTSTATGCSSGPDLDGASRGRGRGRRGSVHLLGRDRRARGPASAGGAAAAQASPA